MGTNFYVIKNHCSHCGRYENIHLGKSSAGSRFLFHYQVNMVDIIDVILLTRNNKIENEYEQEISFDDFWGMVQNKQSEKQNESMLNPIIVKNGFDFYPGEWC